MKRQIAQTPYFGPNVENFVAQRADSYNARVRPASPPSDGSRPIASVVVIMNPSRRGAAEGDARRRRGERSRGREGEETEDTEYVRLDVHRDDHRFDELDDDDVDARARGIRETDRARARGSIDG